MHSYYDYYQVYFVPISRSLSRHVETEEGNSNFMLSIVISVYEPAFNFADPL